MICAMIVDDDPLVGRVVSRALFAMGCTAVSVVQSGQAALDMIAGGLRPQVIVCDGEMPGMSGLEFWHQLSPELQRRTVFFTGSPEMMRGVSVPVICKPNHNALTDAVAVILVADEVRRGVTEQIYRVEVCQ